VFFTFSYADNHMNDLHKLMPGGFSNCPKQRYKNVLNNPHLVDFYFSFRLTEFLKVVFDGILDCEWRWHRYEWQSRSSIHCHGAAKFKNDPGLRELTNKVYNGRKAQEQLSISGISNTTKDKLNEIVQLGIQAEIIVINYTNTLLTTMNPRVDSQLNEVPDPHPCSLDYKSIPIEDRDKFYENIANCCQVHKCKPSSGYCKKNLNEDCRFGFPKEKCLASHIEFTEIGNTVKANILLQRNDSFMNTHNRLILENWMANVDMQIILDQAAAVAYMVKYATKAEKAGSSLNDLYKSVIKFADENDNTITKLRSLMLKTVAGKRDIGQCEVCRLLNSEPLYSSTFKYVTQSLELSQAKEMNEISNNKENQNNKATNRSLLDFYADRMNNPDLVDILDQIKSFNNFVIKFKDFKNQLKLREDSENTIIVTYPKVRYNPNIIETYKDYCFYQMIKYSDWNIKDLETIKNKETAIERFEKFFSETDEDTKNTIK
jgi:hypothetical protein